MNDPEAELRGIKKKKNYGLFNSNAEHRDIDLQNLIKNYSDYSRRRLSKTIFFHPNSFNFIFW